MASKIIRLQVMLLLGLFLGAAHVSAQDSSAGLSSNSQYRLSAGDELEVFVWREEELSRPVTISPDGSLSYPLAGEIQASGLTLSELQGQLTERIRGYIPKALVTVTLVKVNGYRVYVLGEVNKPGEYVPGNYVTIAQALTLAEGLTNYANDSSIKVVRQQDGREIFIKFNYSRFKKGKDLSSNVRLESGDVVMVP
ncbi:MAG: polysaccharide biosynthesis/export family protein [Pseudomonadota bacterium]